MTKEKRLMAVTCAMTQSEREDETTFYHFTDTAPEALKDLFLENYAVRNLDYEIFSAACDIVSEMSLQELEDEDRAQELFQERESASVYTSERLSYLSMHNESDISDMMREYSTESIATACAIWYDNEVRRACELIRDYVIA